MPVLEWTINGDERLSGWSKGNVYFVARKYLDICKDELETFVRSFYSDDLSGISISICSGAAEK